MYSKFYTITMRGPFPCLQYAEMYVGSPKRGMGLRLIFKTRNLLLDLDSVNNH